MSNIVEKMAVDELAYELRCNPKRRQLLTLIQQSDLPDEAVEYLEDVYVHNTIYLNDLRRAIATADSLDEVYAIVKEFQRE